MASLRSVFCVGDPWIVLPMGQMQGDQDFSLDSLPVAFRNLKDEAELVSSWHCSLSVGSCCLAVAVSFPPSIPCLWKDKLPGTS